MKRTQIDEQYKWDLTKIYPDYTAFYDDVKLCQELIDDLATYENRLSSDAKTLLNFVQTQEKLGDVMADIYVYSKQSLDVEPRDEKAQQAYAVALSLSEKYSNKLNFISVEIAAKSKQIKELIKDPCFADIQFFFEESFHFKKHTRSKPIQQILAEASNFGSMFQNTFDSIRPTFDPVIVDGKEEFLNHGTLHLFLENPDRNVRKMAYENFYKEYDKLATTYASILTGHIKYVSFCAKQEKYKSALDASLYSDNAPTKLFEKILHAANVKYRPYLHEFFDLIKNIMKLDDLTNYDLNVPPVTDLDLKFSIEEGLEIVYAALAPLGEDYISILKKGVKERWIDFHTHESKRSGAYSWGTYRSQPYILLNWVGNLDSIYTLAHELGHSLHSYYSNNNNRSLLSGYKIFVAEVASTVNEVFLTQYLLKKYAGNEKVTKYLYDHLLADIVGTIYRQPFFAEFERSLYAANESGEALSHTFISNTYRQMSEGYYGGRLKMSDYVGVSCYSVPHFYYRFYVYKYTVGMSCALTIVSRILSGNKTQRDNYLNFLKAGGTKWPIDLLKDAGVDPTSNKVYDEAFTFFKKSLDEYAALFKNK